MKTKTGHKQTPIGEIPDEWAVVKLGDINIDIQQGFASGKRDESGILQLRMNNIATDGRVVLDSYIRVPIPDSIERYLLKPRDILFNNTNSVDLVGKTAIFREKCDFCTYSNHITRIRVDKAKVVPEWILYNFIKKWQGKYFRQICVRHVGQAGIRKADLARTLIPLPPLPEQRRIAEILTTADTAIRKVGDAIAKTERLKKGLMQEFLTKGIGHEEFKDSEVGRIPRGWQVTTLRAECVVGTGGTPSRKHPEYFGGTVPWIKTTEVNYNTIMETGECITELGLQNSNAKIYPAGTLIIAMYGQGVTRGKCAILGMDAAMNQACAAVTPKNDNITHVKYLQYWCQFKYDQIRNLGQGANQSNLNLSVVGSMRFPLPSISEQHRIAEILSTVDKKLELERKRKEKLERIKKGLMNELLTGKKRVKIAR